MREAEKRIARLEQQLLKTSGESKYEHLTDEELDILLEERIAKLLEFRPTWSDEDRDEEDQKLNDEIEKMLSKLNLLEVTD